MRFGESWIQGQVSAEAAVSEPVTRTETATLALVAIFAGRALGAMVACRPPDDGVRPAPEVRARPTAPSASPAPRSSERHVDATVVRWLGVGWANVLDLDLRGDLRGPASLWVPAGDASEAAIVASASKPGAKLTLVLAPLAAPDGGAGGPYVLHVEQRGDGGVVYWSVKSTTIATIGAAAAP